MSGLAGWADLLGEPRPESPRSRRLAHLGGMVAITALAGYLTWRVLFTLPAHPAAAWALIGFEAIPLVGLVVRLVTLWDIDSHAPAEPAPPGTTVAVLIPTYDEPAEVIVPTIAAACALEPAHQTWVLDDGDRDWVQELCRSYGARYVRRSDHDHAKAGNLNHALDLMERERADVDVIAVLDCDHVPLPHFLTATLGWFADPRIALVQGPQSFYNAGSFDDDGIHGEQGLFFNVLMAARNRPEAGPFWCGSTALLRRRALTEVGGVATDTIVEDMHTTLRLLEAGWRTTYHHQTLAVGLAPQTAEQYLLQRRRWGMGAMQVLLRERLWGAKRWLSWRSYYEYLTGTLWWLEGAGSVLALLVPVSLLLTGAQTSTAPPALFGAMFLGTFAARLWGAKRLYRHQLSWRDALALRVLRIPVGLSCLWWLVTRRALSFQVTPKSGADERVRSRVPTVLQMVLGGLAGVSVSAVIGLAGLAPWRASAGATVASGAWLLLALSTVALGMRRIIAEEHASSRRNAHRFTVDTDVLVEGRPAELLDVSVGGLRIRIDGGEPPPGGFAEVHLPGTDPVKLAVVRVRPDGLLSLRTPPHDWAAMRTLALWLFHTPAGVVPALPPGVPAAAAVEPSGAIAVRRSRSASALVRLEPSRA